MKPTKEQLEAIKTGGTNIIVSAGAGSGKTEVLSERVIDKLKQGIHVNELLILTFTNAAAFNMKDRIQKKISEHNELKNEYDLVLSADITTFDAFSLFLVKKYHYLLNLDANLSIIDTSIINVKKKEFIDQIFNEYYLKNDKYFNNLVLSFSLKNDNELKKFIKGLDNKLDLLSDKEGYLNTYIKNYFNDNYLNELFGKFERQLLERVKLIDHILIKMEGEVPEDFYNCYKECLSNLLKATSYDEIKNGCDFTNPRLNNPTDLGKKYRDKIKSIVSYLKETTASSKEKLITDVENTQNTVQVIIDILTKLNDKTKDYKIKHQKFEFNDISKFAIKIVKENKDVKEELKYHYKEIMIDEYQDTSDLQEEFINLIENNNVYMVGDIKQSIYRFRNANPNIFRNKYNYYKKNQGGIKIDLNKNFRSREEVINSINEIFNHIMDETIGNASYKQEHQLIAENPIYKEQTNNNNNLEIYSYIYNNKWSKEETEAFIIAYDIKDKIRQKYEVIDNQTKRLRPSKYSDYCILMDRGNSFKIYKKIFDYLNIPLNICQDENIMESDECIIIKSIINFIINIKEDIFDANTKLFFASIARSYLFNMKDQELYDILTNNKIKDTTIYHLSLDIAKQIDFKSNEQIINIIIDKFNFYEKIINAGNILNRTIILDNLISKFKELSSLNMNINDAINYLDTVIKENEKLTIPAKEEEKDAVTITNIHKSKGLEYNICYYSGLYKEFNKEDTKQKVRFDAKDGIIIPNMDNGLKDTFINIYNKEKYKIDEISERLRLFYVALTRCKEKMIIVSDITEEDFYFFGKSEMVDYLTKISYKSFNDILKSIYPFIKDRIKLIDLPNITKEYLKSNTYSYQGLIGKEEKIMVNEIEVNNDLINEAHYSKTPNSLFTIDEINNMNYGTHLHYILENIDFKNPNYDLLNDEEINIIKSLLNNPIMNDIKNAKIYKEYNFIEEKESIIKTGIIDLMIEYDDHINIIDYKLKHTSDEAYLKQLNGYKSFIENKTNKKTYIYLYSLLDKNLINLN